MKVLVIGGGGREHALCWALAKEAEVYCAPGNPGISEVATCLPIGQEDAGAIIASHHKHHYDLVVIGPEDPLIHGLADPLRAAGIAVFGPGESGAQLEGSKAFSKALMDEAEVPTARFKVCSSPDEAKRCAAQYAQSGKGVVIKASGSALGKGAVVCDTLAEGEAAIDDMLLRRTLGEAGSTIVVEERLKGPEFSLLTLVSGEYFYSLPPSQDYKRANDGDLGPNTGGMGSISPVPWVDEVLIEACEEQIVRPILRALAKKGIDFRGVLFSGILLQGGRPYCLEYNVRFGDPETQSVVQRLGPGLADALLACAQGAPIPTIPTRDGAAATVVIASPGYPDNPRKGFPVTFTSPAIGTMFHAGTANNDGHLVTSGGRVLGASAYGEDLATAVRHAYTLAETVSFEGAWYRQDIGQPVSQFSTA